jgi:NTE family protein
MSAFDKELIFSEILLFAGLTDAEKAFIKKRCDFVEFKKGHTIYKEGSVADAFYCVVLGRVLIYTHDVHGKETPLEYLHRGKYFGIISLLTGDPHSVSAKAINDSLLFVIRKEDFEAVLNRIPRLAIDLSRTLSRRLKVKDIHRKSIFESTIISVFSSYSQSGKTIYALNLGLSLKKETQKSVIVLDIAPQEKMHSLPRRLDMGDVRVLDLSSSLADNGGLAKEYIHKNKYGIDLICFHYIPDDETCVRRLLGIISVLVNDYHYLILDLPSLLDRPIFSILNQSDLIHLLSGTDEVDLKRTQNLVHRLREEFGFQEEKIKIIINEYKLSKFTHDEQVGFLRQAIFATLPKIDFESQDRLVLECPDCEYAKAVRRIARVVGDCQVGLVLGVGVAYGFCHVGVLRVIEQEKIPIDVIAGASIGSIIAALWAIGKTSDEIMDITSEFRESKNLFGLVDFTIPLVGFLKGNKLRKFLNKYFGHKTFYDVKLPLKIIASDVKRKESKIFDRGLLVDALMASCAMPGVFAPIRLKDEMLFDGGVTNPLPTEALVKIGVKKIIAVNVTPSRSDIMRQYDKIKEDIAAPLVEGIKKRKWVGMGERIRNAFKINILDIIFSSVEILQSEVAQKEAQLADVVLHPDTTGLYWLELHRAEEFAKRGEEEARKNLAKIKQLIFE